MSVTDLFSLAGKKALVTGCSRGIGAAMAVALAEAGADIIGVSASLNSESNTAKEVKAIGREFYAYSCDFNDRDDIYNFLNKVQQDHSQIDILINNAGTILRQPVAEHTDEYWDKVININLNAQFIITRELGKQMLKRGSGKIVFTCSLLSYQGGINVPGYTASKSALAGLVKAFANEWAGKGIHVNGIVPGYISTDNTTALREDADRSASILSRIPAGRWGEPDDFKGPVVFLSSDAAAYVHGTLLSVDGGWLGR